MLRLLQARADGLEAGAHTEVGPTAEGASQPPTTTRFTHDSSRTIQPKLAVNTPGDIYEQEADHIAEQVMRMPEPKLQRACACDGGCPSCQTEQPSHEDRRLQTKHVGSSDAGQTAAPPIVNDVLASPGQPLDASTRAFFEPRFGHDFSQVRVHSSGAAEQSARDVNSQAYTVGDNIVFGAGRFSPGTNGGRRLLAHELTHVLQQSHSPEATGSRDISGLSAITEHSSATVQRNVVPREELRRMRDDIDDKLLNPKLSAEERSRLIEERTRLSRSLGDEFEEDDDQGGSGKIPGQTRPGKAPDAVPANVPVEEFPIGPNKKAPRTRAKGASQSQSKSAQALGKSQKTASVVPPPSTRYVNLDRRAGPAELRVGSYLNERAVGGKLGDVSRVEGRPPVGPNTADYAFILKDGSEVKADLYSPTASAKSPEDRAIQVTRKSGQADVVIVELPVTDSRLALEQGHKLADALIANANHSLKRIIVLANNKLILDRSLTVSGKTLLRIQATVLARRESPPVNKGQKDVSSQRDSKAPGGGAPKEPVSTEPRGKAVNEAYGRQAERKGAFEGLAQMLNSWVFHSLQDTEIAKIFKRRKELDPQIQNLREQGYTVTVWGSAEVPDSIDILGGLTDTHDIGQLVYFVDLWLDANRNIPVDDTTSRMSGDPTPGSIHIVRQTPAHPGHHIQAGVLETLPPLRDTRPGEETGRGPDAAGTYSVKFQALFSGPSFSIPPMMMRQLQIEQAPDGTFIPRMSLFSEQYSYLRFQAGENALLRGRFTRKNRLATEPESIVSNMVYYPRLGRILEWVKGFDSMLNEVWDALYTWDKK